MILDHVSKEEKAFVIKCRGWVHRVFEQYVTKKTPFLTLREQAILTSIVAQYDGVLIQYDGGFLNAERQRAVIYQATMPYDLASEIKGLKIKSSNHYVALTHSQILGSLLGLDVKREVLGDIIIDQPDVAYVAVTETFAPYFLQYLHQVGKSSITVTESEISHLARIEAYEEQEVIISSYRLDVIVAALTKLSRQEVSELIKKGFVSHQFVVEQNHSKTCQLGDVISIKKVGRFKLLSEKAITKSKRHVVIIGKIVS